MFILSLFLSKMTVVSFSLSYFDGLDNYLVVFLVLIMREKEIIEWRLQLINLHASLSQQF